MKKGLLLATFVIGLTSCSVQRELLVIDGSKSDGTVTLGTEGFNAGKSVVVDKEKGLMRAKEKCKQWGFNDAEFFDFGIKQPAGGYNVRMLYKVQCVN